MSTPDPLTITIEIRITGDGATRHATLHAPTTATDPAELISRITGALPEFETIERATDYL